jgi:chemotaxis protein MotB
MEGDLAAAEAALAEALAAGATTEAELQAQLAAAVLAQEAAAIEQATATAAIAEVSSERAELRDRLAEALLATQALQAEVASLSESRSETELDRAGLEARLAEALAATDEARSALETEAAERAREAALLALANERLAEEEALSADSLRDVAALTEQVAQLRTELATLQTLLGLAEEEDAGNQVQIETLTTQLNTALLRVAAEARRREALAAAEMQRLQDEAARLAAEAQDLERFRSEFFGRVRDVVAQMDGVEIVGDRFVFSSEVLFDSGQATLSAQGEQEIANVAQLLREIAADIPEGIDWVIRVDGHTDNIALSGFGQFANNWELSQARALSVVLFMIENEGIPPGRLAANGFGEFQPVDPTDTAEARARNRRIELKLTER